MYRDIRYSRIVPILLSILAICQSSAASDTLPAVNMVQAQGEIQRWARDAESYDPRKRTVLLTTSLNGCTPCAINAINLAIRTARMVDPAVNVLVVVASRIPREGLALRRKFASKNVREDTSGILDAVFRAHSILSDAFVVDQTGTVMFYRHDLQRNPLDTAELRHALYNAPASSVLAPRQVVPLEEDIDHTILDVTSTGVDAANGTLYILDDRQNAIFGFDLKTAERISFHEPDSSIAFHFRPPSDNPAHWESLVQDFGSLVKYQSAAFRPGSDTAYILAEFYTGYTLQPFNEGRDTNLTWKTGTAILSWCRGKVLTIDRLPESGYEVVGNALSFGDAVITQTFWERLTDNPPPSNPDSVYEFLLVDTGRKWARPVVHGPSSLYRRNGRLTLRLGRLATTENGELFYFNPFTRAFLRGVRSGDSILTTPIEPAGFFKVLKDSTYSYQADSLYCVDIGANATSMYTAFLSTRQADSSSQIKLQSYSTTGKLQSEATLHTGPDPVQAIKIAGFDTKDMILVVKHSNARWKMYRVAISDL